MTAFVEDLGILKAKTRGKAAVDKTVDGVIYYAYDRAYYRPYYSGSSVFYEVVSNPA